MESWFWNKQTEVAESIDCIIYLLLTRKRIILVLSYRYLNSILKQR